MDIKYALIGLFLVVASIIGMMGFTQNPTGSFVQTGEITLIVDDGASIITKQVRAEGSAFDILRRNFGTIYQGYETGVFITGIETHEWFNNTDDYFWIYFVNNEMPEVSADNYFPEQGDRVVFKYMSSEEAMNFF